ncbi:MAG: hypothetical protein JWN78_476 [Bacteroidota bacterium]|nr:hypothetical protein [Bacteroidota bacterium]
MRKFSLIFLMLLSGAIFAQSIPYNVNKKKFPLGDEFRKILPLKVGSWNRYAFHDFIPGEDGNVYYENGKKEIYMLFGKGVTSADMNIIWTKLYDSVTEDKISDIKKKSPQNGSIKYLEMQGKKSYLFAWSRNLYYFCISTKDKADADDFMKSFPW